MKRKVTALLTALLLTLTLCVPALAWTEYGAIYDETDALGSDELSDLGHTSGCCRIIGISIRLYIAIRTTAKYNGSICLTACHGNLGTTDADLSGST